MLSDTTGKTPLQVRTLLSSDWFSFMKTHYQIKHSLHLNGENGAENSFQSKSYRRHLFYKPQNALRGCNEF